MQTGGTKLRYGHLSPGLVVKGCGLQTRVTFKEMLLCHSAYFFMPPTIWKLGISLHHQYHVHSAPTRHDRGSQARPLSSHSKTLTI